MPRITRKLEFDAGHRVLGHEGKCRHIHGHRYVAEITVDANQLDDLGRVVDFSVIKQLVGKWIDEELDHNLLLNSRDPLWQLFDKAGDRLLLEVLGEKEPFVMPNGNPTAENIAAVLYKKATELLAGKGLSVYRVRLYETPNSWADCDAAEYPIG